MLFFKAIPVMRKKNKIKMQLFHNVSQIISGSKYLKLPGVANSGDRATPVIPGCSVGLGPPAGAKPPC